MSESQVATLDDAVDAKKTRKASVEKVEKSGRYMLTIFSSQDSGGQDAVFVSPGSETMQIPRDKPWEVSAAVVDCLRNAVVTTTTADGKGGYTTADRPRFAFSAVPV